MNELSSSKRAVLTEIDWPDFGIGERPPAATFAELSARLDLARSAMERRNLSHLLVYGDREHFANLAWLTNVDPRFEEALLIVTPDEPPLILVGNECEDYLRFSPLFDAGVMRSERFQTFSLLSQPRADSRLLREILTDEGIGPASTVGCVGWKYLDDGEDPAGRHALDIPSFIADTIRALAGHERVENATDLFMHPGYGLRTTITVEEIAQFEYTNAKAAEGVKKMIHGIRDGMSDHDIARLSEWDGEPLGCHPTLAGGGLPGLCGPQGRVVRKGEPLSFNLCYWGSNICRAGWVADDARDLPPAARDYVAAFAGPYFETMGEWFAGLRIGASGGDLHRLVMERLPYERFGIFLNPGHLIHLDEWVSSPIYEGSTLPLRSGMAMQVDVIPSSAVYGSTRMEDGVVLADAELRIELKARFPDCHARCDARRRFMIETLGFELPDEVLPLSNIAAIVPPWFLQPETVFVLQ